MERAIHRTTTNGSQRSAISNIENRCVFAWAFPPPTEASGIGVPSYREKIHVDVGVPFFHPLLFFY